MAFGGTHMASGGLALTTDWSKCFICVNYSTQFLQDCDHEEADTRLALHLFDAINHGARNILVHTVDTDVIVILIGLFFDINSSAITTTIWVAFGTGRNFRYYNKLTTLSTHWEQTNHEHCHFFIHFQVVTPHHNSMERGKNQ